jgi:hypothetical protein
MIKLITKYNLTDFEKKIAQVSQGVLNNSKMVLGFKIIMLLLKSKFVQNDSRFSLDFCLFLWFKKINVIWVINLLWGGVLLVIKHDPGHWCKEIHANSQ